MYGHGLKDLKTVFSAVARIVRTVPRVALEAAPGDCFARHTLWIHVPRAGILTLASRSSR